MHQILIIPNHTGATACMYYNTKEMADIALKNIHDMQRKEDGVLTIKDEYGFEITMDVKNLSYAMMIDVEKSHKLHGGMSKPQSKILDS